MLRTLQLDVEREVWTAEDVFPDPEFPLNVLFADPQPPIPFHSHTDFLELAIVYKGRAIHRVEDETYPIRAGDVFVIHGNKKHGFEELSDLYLVNIVVDEEKFIEPFTYLNRLPHFRVLFRLEPQLRRRHRFESRLILTPEELGFAMTLVDALVRELNQRTLGFQAMATGLFLQLVGFCCRCYRKEQPPLTQDLIRLGTVLNFIESHYSENIRLEELVSLSGMAQRTFMRVFHEVTGFSPIQYILRLRLAKACYLLSTTSLTITEVAFRTGFDDSNYFTRQFHKLLNMTPRTYRKTHRHPPKLLPFNHGFIEHQGTSPPSPESTTPKF